MPAEYQRTCTRCGKVWHSLVSRETKLGARQACNNVDAASSTCNKSAEMQAKRNVQAADQEINSLKRCPNCGSVAFKERVVS